MNHERKPMDPVEMDAIIKKMQRRGSYSSEIIQLVQSDLALGISKEETEQYTSKRYDIRQMRVYSKCLRKNCTREEISVICKEGLSSCQMEVLFDFFDKGVPLEIIRLIMEEADAIPQRMKKVYEKYLEEIDKAKTAVNKANSEVQDDFEADYVDANYVKELITLLQEVSEKITFQESRYDELNKKLKLFETSKEDEAVRKNLIDEMDDKDSMLEKQQEEINKATGAIARLRKDKEDCEEEIKKMREQMEELQRKVKNQELDLQEANHKLENRDRTENADKKIVRELDQRKDVGPYDSAKTTVQQIGAASNVSVNTSEQRIVEDSYGRTKSSEQFHKLSQPIVYGIPVYYQIPVVDGRGHMIQKVSLDRTERKINGVASILSKLCFKKKSRADIVKLVASGDLAPAQLVHIKSGIEKGLTESQLVELINNNLAVEKMKEIIEIAVLENSMEY